MEKKEFIKNNIKHRLTNFAFIFPWKKTLRILRNKIQSIERRDRHETNYTNELIENEENIYKIFAKLHESKEIRLI